MPNCTLFYTIFFSCLFALMGLPDPSDTCRHCGMLASKGMLYCVPFCVFSAWDLARESKVEYSVMHTVHWVINADRFLFRRVVDFPANDQCNLLFAKPYKCMYCSMLSYFVLRILACVGCTLSTIGKDRHKSKVQKEGWMG